MPIRFSIIILLLMQVACKQEQPEAGTQLIPVRVQSVQKHDINAGIRYSASVTPLNQVDLAFKVNGYINSITQTRRADGSLGDITPGEAILKNSVLAQINDNEYRDQLKQAQANLKNAQAAWVKAQQDYQRANALYSEHSMTAPDYDSAIQEYQSAKDNVSAARGQLDVAKIQLGYCRLKAPFSGVLISRNIAIGSLVSPATVAFQLADMSSVKVVFAVPDVMLKHIALGDVQKLTTRSIPNQVFSGKVTSIAPAADLKTRVFEIEISVPNPDQQLKINMVAALQVKHQPAPDAAIIEIPIDAIVASKNNNKTYAVYIVEQGKNAVYARLKDVQLGQVNGNNISVLSGLSTQEQVIVSGVNVVWDGSQINIIN